MSIWQTMYFIDHFKYTKYLDSFVRWWFLSLSNSEERVDFENKNQNEIITHFGQRPTKYPTRQTKENSHLSFNWNDGHFTVFLLVKKGGGGWWILMKSVRKMKSMIKQNESDCSCAKCQVHYICDTFVIHLKMIM